MNKDIKFIDPLSNAEKEKIFDIKIEYLTNKEIFDRYGSILTKEEKIKLKINKNE